MMACWLLDYYGISLWYDCYAPVQHQGTVRPLNILLQAYAAARMAESVLRGLAGEDAIYECAYVQSDVTELPFFASKVRLGPDGAEEVLPIGELTEVEQKALQEAISQLRGNIDKGIAFANSK